MTDLSEKTLYAAICGMIDAVRTPQGFEVTLPQAYASGNIVSVVIAETETGFSVHDNSYAAMVLERSGTSKAPSLAADVAGAVAAYGCEFEQMRVVRRVTSLDEVALAAVLVGCASRLVADKALDVDRLPLFDFKARLLGKVTEAVGLKRIRTNEPVVGHLGSRYKVSTVVLDAPASEPVAFIEPISEAGAVARKFKEFYDISLNSDYGSIERISVLDDTKSIPAGDVLLMQEVSTLVRFSDASTIFKQWATVQ